MAVRPENPTVVLLTITSTSPLISAAAIIPLNWSLTYDQTGAAYTSAAPSKLTVPNGYSLASLYAQTGYQPSSLGSIRVLVISRNNVGALDDANIVAQSVEGAKDTGPTAVRTGWVTVAPGDYFEVFAQKLVGTDQVTVSAAYGGSSFQLELL